jgi:Carboxypeptidase regulatory-like domain
MPESARQSGFRLSFAFPTARLALKVALIVSVCAGFAFLPGKLFAQGATATINGVVSDTTGAVIPSAQIVLRNTATDTTRTTSTNQTGSYGFVSVFPGTYTLQISKQGFKTTSQPAFALNVNQTATYNFTLAVGATTQEVTVQSSAVAIETSTAELGTAVTTRKVNDLPLNGRNFTQLLTLTPGAAPVSVAQNGGGGGGFAGKALGTFSFPAVQGQRNRSNLFYLDGMSDTGSFIDNYNYQPMIDQIQEFKVQSHNDQAAFGQALGGLVNVATKAGTNQYHGSLWEFLRNEKLDARNTFFAGRNPLRENQYGGTVGGPLSIPKVYNGKNKTFFFFGFEGYRQHQAAQSLFKTLTPANLGGDLTDQSGQIYNPYSTVEDLANPGTYLRDPFMCDVGGNPLPVNGAGIQAAGTPCNKIPSSLLDPIGTLYAQTFFPAPVNTGVAGFNGLNNTPVITTQDSVSLRLDQQVGTKDSLMGRFSNYNQVDTQPGSFPKGVNQVFLHGYNWVAHETHTFGPSMVLDVHAGRNWGQDNSVTNLLDIPSGFLGQLESAGLASNFVTFQDGSALIPSFGLSGYIGGGGQRFQNTRISDVWEFGGDLSLIRGHHMFKMGATFDTNNTNSPIFGASNTYDSVPTSNPASPSGTGNSIASFLLGIPSSAGKRDVLEVMSGGWVDGFYFQDQWKASKKLTVNLGVRYDLGLWPVYGDPNAKSGYVGSLNLNDGTYILTRQPPACSATVGEPCIPGGTLPANVVLTQFKNGAIYHNDFKDIQPRVGLAYLFDPKTVIRASYGRFYDNWNSMIQLAQNYEGTWPRVGQLLANNLNATLITAGAGDPFHLGTGVIYPAPTPFNQVQWFMDPLASAHTPYAEQWNFGVQRELTSNTTVELTYVGSHDGDLNLGGYKNTAVTPGPGDAATVASRRPYPYISPTYYDQNIGRSNFNALEFRLDKSTSHGLSYLVSYTYSKSIDLSCSGDFGAEGCELQNAYNINAERSVSGFDLTHNLSASWVWQLPFGSGGRYSSSNRFMNGVIGGWQLNGIVTMTSGAPYDIRVSGDIANTGNVVERANLVGAWGSWKPSNPTPSNWLNASAFAVPANYTFGTLGRNTLRNDWYKDFDLSIFRRFTITERTSLEFRAEAFNLTNTPVYGTPSNNISNPNFGVISGTRNDPRELQFGLKLYF